MQGGELRSSLPDARPTANRLVMPPDLSGRRAEVEGGEERPEIFPAERRQGGGCCGFPNAKSEERTLQQIPRNFAKFSFHFSNLVSFFRFIFNFSSHGRVDFAPECPSRQSKMIFRKISAIRLKMVCCMPLSSHKKVPYSKERQRLHAFCHGVPQGFFRACKALGCERDNTSSDSIVESNMKT